MNTIFKKHIITTIVLIITTIVSLIMIVFLVLSMNTKISRVLETKERLSSYQKNNKAYKEEAEQFKLLEKRLEVLESKIVSDQTVSTFLSFLEDLAQKDGTDFEITSVQSPVQDEKKSLSIDFNIKGTYSDVRLFLDQIQHQPYQIKFSKLDIFSETPTVQAPQVVQTPTPGTKPVAVPTTPVLKERQWTAVATIEVVSF